jgi:hypothetical protein
MTPDQQAEEELRRLQAEIEGTDPEHQLEFLGVKYPVRPATGGLIAVLRYCRLASGKEPENETEQLNRTSAWLAATYRLLSEVIEPASWYDFQQAALDGKASQDDVEQAVSRVLEIYTARPSVAAVRLLAWASAHLAEMDGQLLRGGTALGLASLTARQLCNIIFTARLESMETDEQRQDFRDDLNSVETAEGRALKAALDMIERRKAQEAQDGAGADGTVAAGDTSGGGDGTTDGAGVGDADVGTAAGDEVGEGDRLRLVPPPVAFEDTGGDFTFTPD